MLYLHAISSGIWSIESGFAANFLPIIANFIQGKPTVINRGTASFLRFAALQSGSPVISEYDQTAPSADVVAVIDINGAMTKYDQDCGPAGMHTVSRILTQLYANDSVKSVVLNIDSGGGESYACMLLQATISQRNKPVVAFVNDCCCSAAYGIASQCDLVIANGRMARIGCIGTMTTLVDYQEYYASRGIRIEEFYADKSTDKNSDIREALAGKPEKLLQTINTINTHFIGSIAKCRGEKLPADETIWASGKVFFAEEAVAVGLVDRVDSLENVINYFNI